MHPGLSSLVPRGVVGEGEQEQSGGTEPDFWYSHQSNQLAIAVVTLPVPGQQRCLTSGKAERSSERGEINEFEEKDSQVQGLPTSSFPNPQSPGVANISGICV